MNICVYGASSDNIDPIYLENGEALGLEMAKRGHGLVFGGGAHGMMGAVARGMTRGNGQILGIAPKFFDKGDILYTGCAEFVYTETMRERKSLMEQRADAFLMTPGGIGTFEEFYEILTLRQLGQHNKPIAVLNTKGYFDPLLQMQEKAMAEGFLKPVCRDLFREFTDVKALLDYLESDEATAIDVRHLKNI